MAILSLYSGFERENRCEMPRFTAIAGALCLFATPALAEFSLSFEWGNIPRCTTGFSNTVGNPRFVLRDVPAGTETVEFRLTDLDMPSYNHGGGRVRTNGASVVPADLFNYLSPCPPSGHHTYRWTATARSGTTVLGRATADRRYPE